ncbi:MAG: LTA synthase family protein [Oscillospiraceae bacterium]|nr:LTA synthase family protein [Oscillospiraceae bacterium]
MPVFYLFELESFNSYPVRFLQDFLPKHIPIIIFDLILLYILFAVVFFLVKKAWINVFFFSILMSAASLTNYIKYALTGENFLPHDIIMAGNMNEIVNFISIDLPWWAWVLIAIALFAAIIPGVFAKDAPFKFYIRIPVAVILSTVIVIFFGNSNIASKVFYKIGLTYEATDNQDTHYRARGFVGAFSVNISSFAIQKPEGYSNAKLETELNKYLEVPPSDDFANPDIIVVLSESFWDPRLLPGSEITPNPFENFDELSSRENSYSGGLIVPAFGGGTIRTEFEILTGFSVDALPKGVVPYNVIKKNIPSYVSYYKDLGYDAIAIHPYLARFYNREKCFPRLGFDEYYAESLSDIKEVTPYERGYYVSDDSFVDYLEYFLNNADKPMFLFGITMENHQGYRFKFDYNKFTVRAVNPNLNEEDDHKYKHYVQGVQDADASLGKLCEFIDNRERPTVVVFFGDHLPSICSNNTAYLDTGFISDTQSSESKIKLYTTPFIVYSNFKLNKNAANHDFVASYDLLNLLASLIGSGKTRYMGYLDALREVVPYYNVRLNIKLTTEQKEFLRVQYYATYNAVTK